MMRLIKQLLCCCVCLLYSCTPSHNSKSRQWTEDHDKLKILCTTAMVQDMVQGVGGDYIDCSTLIQGENDPHSYQIVKGDDEKLARADLVFFSGLGLEHGPSLINFLEHNPKAFSLGDYIAQNDPNAILIIDGTEDPHIWMDIALFSQSIPYILEVLQEKLPHKKEQLALQAVTFQKKLKQAHEKVIDTLAKVSAQKRYLVTTHDAFNYFARAYLATPEERATNSWQMRCQAPEGLAPDSQLSTVDIQRLLEYLTKYDITVIFAESNVSQDSIRKLTDAANKLGQKVVIAKTTLYGDAMGEEGTLEGMYPGMIQYDADTIQKALNTQ